MRPVDMFSPIGEKSLFGKVVYIPEASPKGNVYSSHVVSLRSPHISARKGMIYSTEQSSQESRSFSVPIQEEKTVSSPFQTKRIPESTPHNISLERQLEKTKKIIHLEEEFLRQPEQNIPFEKRGFFRNIRYMMSIGIVFLGTLLCSGAFYSAVSTFAETEVSISHITENPPQNGEDIAALLDKTNSLSQSASFFLTHTESTSFLGTVVLS